jgi:aminoglycoside 2'-N-acetyltransferase I
MSLDLQVIQGARLSVGQRRAVVDLCTLCFEEDMEELLATFRNATHVLGTVERRLVSHALWITRWLQVGTGPLLRTAYVEAVATHPAFRRRGYAAAVMNRLASEIEDYDLAALSPFSVAYYARLGWELWRGPLFIRRGGRRIRSPEDEDVMILRLPETSDIDLTRPLSAEWREGELW